MIHLVTIINLVTDIGDWHSLFEQASSHVRIACQISLDLVQERPLY